MRKSKRDLRIAGEYADLIATDAFRTTAPKVAFCVSTTDLNSCHNDPYVAAGLGRSLKQLGYEVAFFPAGRWESLPENTDIAIAMVPGVNPLKMPHRCRILAWVRGETDEWLAHRYLALFDAVMATSSISLTRISKRFIGPTGLLPPGVDTELFRLRPMPWRRRDGVVAIMNNRVHIPELPGYLGTLDINFPLSIFGNGDALGVRLQRYAAGEIGIFAFPAIYRRSLLVLDEMDHRTRSDGDISSTILESLAAGALPLTNSRLGTTELGLSEIPTYSDASTLRERVYQFLSDRGLPHRVQRLGEDVRRTHSLSRRAGDLEALVKRLPSRPRRHTQRIVGYFPSYQNNPYQSMLMAGLREMGCENYPIEDVIAAPAPHSEHGRLDNYVLHLHWTAPILQAAKSAEQAMDRLVRFQRSISSLIDRGGKMIWTIHNILPHECPYVELEEQLAAFIAESADVIHILNPATPDLVAPHYRLPLNKLRLIPHSSYVGIYPDALATTMARSRLGIADDELIYLFFGGIRPYRGLDLLLDAFEEVCESGRRIRLIVAGTPGRFPGAQLLGRRCGSNPQVTAVLRTIPRAQVQMYFKASDAVVLPYRSILNSGALQLALTFGRPVIAPRLAALSPVLDPAYSRPFEPSDSAALGRVLLRGDELANAGMREAAHRAALKYRPQDMGRDYALLVGDLLGRSRSGVGHRSADANAK